MKYLKNFNYIYLFLVVAGLVSIGLYIKTTDLIRIARHELMACFDLEEELLATKAQVENLAPEEMVDPLGSLGKRFNKVAGSEKIKSAISKARRALKSRNPSKEKAQKQLDKAIKLYSEQVEWRTDAAISILAKINYL